MAKPLVLNVRELADSLQVSMPTAYAMTELPGFPVFRVGKKKLIPVADLEAWLSREASKGTDQKALELG